MSCFKTVLVTLLALGASNALAQAVPVTGDNLVFGVDAAVSRAVQYLWDNHQEDHWRENTAGALPREFGGRTALCTFALLTAGESYQQPRMINTLAWLMEQDLQGVYARSFRACALGQLPPGIANRAAVFDVLAADASWLVQAMRPDGAYTYIPSQAQDDIWDNSNTQIALLGVWSAAQAGADVPLEYFKRMEQHWARVQTGDGGFTYADARGKAYGSMTAAGLASLFICFDIVHRDDFLYCRLETENPSIGRGLNWLARNFSATNNPGKGGQYFPYYLYMIERVGRASGHKLLGAHNWYAEGARELLRTQSPDGSWGDEVETAFAMLFLAGGRQPVLMQKLRYNGSWNTRPRDLANLTRWINRTYESKVRWQVLDESAAAEEWFDAPILYISGTHAPRFRPETLDKLRLFVLRGGLILSEAACNDATFTIEMRKLYQKLLPGYSLDALKNDHPAYTRPFRLNNPPSLLAISNGVRLLAIHSPSDLSKAWQSDAVLAQRNRFEQAANLYAYVTDSGSLSSAGLPRWPLPAARAAGQTIRVARLTSSGNWQPEPLADERLMLLMASEAGVELHVDVLRPAQLRFQEHGVALLTGTGDLTLSSEDKAALSTFCQAGGLLVVDAAGGDESFDKAVQRDVLTLLEDVPARDLPLTAPLLRLPGMEIERVEYRQASRAAYGADSRPRLRAVSPSGAPVILYSRDDITSSLIGYQGGGFRGLSSDSAFKLMRNIILYGHSRHQQASRPVLEVQWLPSTSSQ